MISIEEGIFELDGSELAWHGVILSGLRVTISQKHVIQPSGKMTTARVTNESYMNFTGQLKHFIHTITQPITHSVSIKSRIVLSTALKLFS